MQGSIVYSKIQVVTHHYQRFLYSQYLLLAQIQAQQKVSKCPHIKNDSISTHRGQSIQDPKSDATLTLKKRNKMHVFTHKFALIFHSTFDSAYSRSKMSF
ncbi:hypothetical protein H5410_004897 [Solanum commersonii]|uniref:Uncharacterized protein n=1 Tax=Solanum commersonii TaxID=4109 RepID=A0A9J6A6J7_SOLCO|nr:hypothetical protein H5410_004897 [Solanum commersonii]